jgi:hypothetical protein
LKPHDISIHYQLALSPWSNWAEGTAVKTPVDCGYECFSFTEPVLGSPDQALLCFSDPAQCVTSCAGPHPMLLATDLLLNHLTPCTSLGLGREITKGMAGEKH